MNKSAIIHSFHSQVYQTLGKLAYEPDIIVALDAHLDVHMGSKEALELMPKEIRSAALRASSHTMIRRVVGGIPALLKAEGLPPKSLPEMFVVVPQISIYTHVFEIMGFVKDAILSGAIPEDTFKKPVEEFLEFQSRMFGMKVFASPPRNLMKLIDNMRGTHYALVDLDVDYLYEFQDECYTPLKKAQLGDLGWTEQVLKLIRKARPSVITVSEATISAINNPNSNFSKLIMKLRNLGYSISRRQIFASDDEAECSLKIYQDFYEKVQKPLQKRQFAQSGSLDLNFDEIREATSRYFKSLKK